MTDIKKNKTIKEITRDQLTEIDRFDHQNVVSFLKEKAMGKTLLSQCYMIANLITLLLFSVLLGWSIVFDFKKTLMEILITCASFPLFIVAHEGLHGIAYKIIGARKVSFDMHLKKFVFVTIVYEELFAFKRLVPVIVAPAFGLLWIPIIPFIMGYHLVAFGLLSFHVLTIGGDLLLLNYYLLNRVNYDLYTEDLRTKVSIIYKRN